MGPSRITYPYRARTTIEQAPEAIEFCLRVFGPCVSEGLMIKQVMRRNVAIKKAAPSWWFDNKATVAKFFFTNANDLIRFNIAYGNEPGYKVTYDEPSEL